MEVYQNNMNFMRFICAIIESVSKSNSVIWFHCVSKLIVGYSSFLDWDCEIEHRPVGDKKGNLNRTKAGYRYQFLFVFRWSRNQPFQNLNVFYLHLTRSKRKTATAQAVVNPLQRPTSGILPFRWLGDPYHDHFPPRARRNPHLQSLVPLCSLHVKWDSKLPFKEKQEMEMFFCWGWWPMVL